MASGKEIIKEQNIRARPQRALIPNPNSKTNREYSLLILCKYSPNGCNRGDYGGTLKYHEEFCEFQNLVCPSKHNNTCTWTGPFDKLIQHAVETNCIQTLQETHAQNTVIGQIYDLGDEIFGMKEVIQLKPVLLTSPDIAKYWLYMLLQRNHIGLWTIQIRSYKPRPVCHEFTIKLCLSNATDRNSSKYTFEGQAITSTLTFERALREGTYMLLSDAHVRELRKDNILFKYEVSVLPNKNAVLLD